jgi:hypothetical protein
VWHGEAWTDTGNAPGGTINELTGMYDLATRPICVQGTLIASESSLGLVGFNAQQDQGSDVISPWYAGITYQGIHVNITQSTSVALRVEITGEDDVPYCAVFGNGDTVIDWGNFRSECWSSTGTTYDKGIGVSQLKVYAPGTTSGTTTFDFCINDLSPAPAK